MGSRMKEKRDRKKYMLVFAGLAVVLAAAGLIGVPLRGQFFLGGQSEPGFAKGCESHM